MNKVLIVVDVQEDFTRGALRNENAIKALPVIHDVVRFAKDNHFNAIIYTADTHFQSYLETLEGKNLPVPHCIKGMPGWQICPEVGYEEGLTPLLEKYNFGSLDWADWPAIEDSDEIWICGFCTDICVSANYQILRVTYPELPITVISDACAGVTPELHDAALKVMASCQARIATWDELKKENEK